MGPRPETPHLSFVGRARAKPDAFDRFPVLKEDLNKVLAKVLARTAWDSVSLPFLRSLGRL